MEKITEETMNERIENTSDRLDRWVKQIKDCPHRIQDKEKFLCKELFYSRCGFLKCPEI